MRNAILIVGLLALLTGCSSTVIGHPGRGRPAALRVPPGHYPPRGMCRVWYGGRPPGHQPPPRRCGALRGRVPHGAYLLYGGRAWDSRYDWHRHERRNRGSVPAVVLEVFVD